MAIEHADFDGIERLALVTGGEITSTFNDPENVKLGHCKLIEEIMIGEDRLIHFSGVALGQACTIVLSGARSVSVAWVLRRCPPGFVGCVTVVII
jgi:T-complex protein 1 subunit beta